MAEKGTITIERPSRNTLSAQVGADLVDRFVHTATDKHVSFRSNKETFQHALESAIRIALDKFLKGPEA